MNGESPLSSALCSVMEALGASQTQSHWMNHCKPLAAGLVTLRETLTTEVEGEVREELPLPVAAPWRGPLRERGSHIQDLSIPSHPLALHPGQLTSQEECCTSLCPTAAKLGLFSTDQNVTISCSKSFSGSQCRQSKTPTPLVQHVGPRGRHPQSGCTEPLVGPGEPHSHPRTLARKAGPPFPFLLFSSSFKPHFTMYGMLFVLQQRCLFVLQQRCLPVCKDRARSGACSDNTDGGGAGGGVRPTSGLTLSYCLNTTL